MQLLGIPLLHSFMCVNNQELPDAFTGAHPDEFFVHISPFRNWVTNEKSLGGWPNFISEPISSFIKNRKNSGGTNAAVVSGEVIEGGDSGMLATTDGVLTETKKVPRKRMGFGSITSVLSASSQFSKNLEKKQELDAVGSLSYTGSCVAMNEARLVHVATF
jgi:hypothetical protein